MASLRMLALGLSLTALPAAAQSFHLPVGADRDSPVATPSTPATPVVRAADVSVLRGGFSEGFEQVSTLPSEGWAIQNNSDPVGTSSWFQGNPTVFPAHTGADSTYIGANFNNTSGGASGGDGIIWNWLVTPPLSLQNGTTFSFWTRTVTPGATVYPDRMQVRLSTAGTSTNVGTAAGEFGDFTTLLLDINETYSTTGYPSEWTQYTVTVSGLAGPTVGRFAFLYFVENAGPLGIYSNFIGIDDVSSSAVTVAGEGRPEASAIALSAAAPNPVAATTTLTFSLAEASDATLTVVDALGRTVSTLAAGRFAAGTHPVAWDASTAAPGVYMVRLQAASAVATQRIVVAR